MIIKVLKKIAGAIWRMVLDGISTVVGAVVLGLIALAAIWFAPSLDRAEEAHGFLMADNIIRGNGVLVGTKINGVDRVAFLTCKHVVTTRYLPANRSYREFANEDYRLYLNVPGTGFRYAGISHIAPGRWHLAEDDDVDMAWLVLTDAEMKEISGTGKLRYIEIQKGLLSLSEGMLCERNFADAGITRDSEVEATRILSPVKGDQSDPVSCRYSRKMLDVPNTKLALAYVHQVAGTLLSTWQKVDVTTYGGERHQPHVSVFNVSSSIGNSGSPVFGKDKNGDKKLLGLVIATDGKVSLFQSFDFVLDEIRNSLDF